MSHKASIVIGVDESGCGALAGPLVVCAAAFRRGENPPVAPYIDGRGRSKTIAVRDSKKISNPAHREVLDAAIRTTALGTAVVETSPQEIDRRLLRQAFPETLRLAVTRLLEQLFAKGLPRDPHEYVVVFDGEVPMPKDLRCHMYAVPDGDNRIWQVSAASIVAKVARDAVMDKLHRQYPNYNFAEHKGYPTRVHKILLAKHGASDAHRRTFRPVAECQGRHPAFEV